MKIKIHGYLTIKKAMGNRSSFELETEGSTIKNILKELCGKFGEDFEKLIIDQETNDVSGLIQVFVNGRHCNFLPNRMDSDVKDGDTLSIFPPIAGG